ncbi:MAG: cell division protein ZapA [Bacteroidia bacterium]|nr:cell division protein ZapA [Bacteroidia bacterium]
MNEVSIEIQLANRKYPLKIQETDNEAVAKAVALVNAKLKEFEEKYHIRDIQDLFAMSALQLAVQYNGSSGPHTLFPEHLADRLSQLNSLLEESLKEV